MGPDESYRYLPPDELSKIIDTSKMTRMYTYDPPYMRSVDGSISLASEPTPLWSDHIAPPSYYKWGDYVEYPEVAIPRLEYWTL